jgi:hypothetical protein
VEEIKVSAKKQKEKMRRNDLNHAATEIDSIRESLAQAYQQFNNTTDSDALDACIFEISALRSRYNTALKHYRKRCN